jgi:hypothetical protein
VYSQCSAGCRERAFGPRAAKRHNRACAQPHRCGATAARRPPTGTGRGGHREPGAPPGVRGVPPGQCRPRQDVLPVRAASSRRPAPARVRPLCLQPLGRRVRGLLHRPGPRRTGGVGRPCPRRSRPRRVRRPDHRGRRPHRAHVGHRAPAVRRLPGCDADGHHRHPVRHVRRPSRLHVGVGECDRTDDAARPRPADARRARQGRLRSERRSSCRTSCGTSAKTCAVAGSTYPWRTCAGSR